jgi:hypothetical protein
MSDFKRELEKRTKSAERQQAFGLLQELYKSSNTKLTDLSAALTEAGKMNLLDGVTVGDLESGAAPRSAPRGGPPPGPTAATATATATAGRRRKVRRKRKAARRKVGAGRKTAGGRPAKAVSEGGDGGVWSDKEARAEAWAKKAYSYLQASDSKRMRKNELIKGVGDASAENRTNWVACDDALLSMPKIKKVGTKPQIFYTLK